MQQNPMEKQHRRQHQNLFWQFVQLNVAVPGDVVDEVAVTSFSGRWSLQ